MESNNKRILFVTDLWTESPYGILTVVRGLKTQLEQRGCTIALMEPSQFYTFSFPLYPDVRLSAFAWRSVERRIATGRYDHIHILTEGPLGIYARRACRKARVPYTTAFNGQLHVYMEIWMGKFMGRVAKRLLAWFHRDAAAILVSTQRLKDQLETDFGLRRVELCPLGVDPLFFGSGTCPAAFEKPVFMYFGRLTSEKNIEEFLQLSLSGTKLLVGDGPDRKTFEAQHPEARFVGYQSGQQLLDWCACADVMVMPSRTETFGFTILESLAFGIPVAAHRVMGPADIIEDGVTGYLDDDLAAAARQSLSLNRAKCREAAQRFDWRVSADRFLDILSSLSRASIESVHGIDRE